MRQFTFIDAMCECNAKQAYNYWVRSKQDKPLMTNIEFRHAMMVQLINNPEWKRAQQIGESNFVDQSIPGPPVCKLKHYEVNGIETLKITSSLPKNIKNTAAYGLRNARIKCVHTAHVNPS